MTSLTAKTRVAAVIGDPIAQSLSPAIHNAAFAADSLDYLFVAFRVSAGGGSDAVAAARALGLAAMSVTMPLKAEVADACDELSPTARRLGAVNTVIPIGGGRFLGDSTDGEGFLASITDAGISPGDHKILVLGAGGAARAVIHVLGLAGAQVTVAARRLELAQSAAALAPGGESILLSSLDDELCGASAVVNATPSGMADGTSLLPGSWRGHVGWVADLVYGRIPTPLLAQADERGILAIDGLGMLVHQAAIAYTLWTGLPAPLEIMRAAARAGLATAAT